MEILIIIILFSGAIYFFASSFGSAKKAYDHQENKFSENDRELVRKILMQWQVSIDEIDDCWDEFRNAIIKNISNEDKESKRIKTVDTISQCSKTWQDLFRNKFQGHSFENKTSQSKLYELFQITEKSYDLGLLLLKGSNLPENELSKVQMEFETIHDKVANAAGNVMKEFDIKIN